MKFYFPQWQGSGYTNEIETGARTLRNYFADTDLVEVPLSDAPLEISNDIKGFHTLLAQLSHFKNTVQQKNPDTIFTIGGDCGLEIVPVSYLNQKYDGDLAVLWFDAHADLNVPEESPSKNFHGMPLRTLLGEGDAAFTDLLFQPITDAQIFYLGLRDTDPAERQRIEQGGIFYQKSLVTYELIDAILERGFNHIYIHLDFDVLDPAQFADTKYQVAGGVGVDELAGAIEQLCETFNPVGFSLLETTATESEPLTKIRPLLDLWHQYGNI